MVLFVPSFSFWFLYLLFFSAFTSNNDPGRLVFDVNLS